MRQAVEAPVDDQSIRPGDALELFVKEDSSFNGIYGVRERGDIIIPSVGRIPVEGLDVSQARDAIEKALEASQLKEASLIVDRVRRVRAPDQGAGATSPSSGDITPRILVYYTGKVNRPGQHHITLASGRPVGVYESLLIAGGISRFGDKQKVHVLRMGGDGKRYRIPVDIQAVEEGQIPDPPVGDGDIVVVPEKVFGF